MSAEVPVGPGKPLVNGPTPMPLPCMSSATVKCNCKLGIPMKLSLGIIPGQIMLTPVFLGSLDVIGGWKEQGVPVSVDRRFYSRESSIDRCLMDDCNQVQLGRRLTSCSKSISLLFQNSLLI